MPQSECKAYDTWIVFECTANQEFKFSAYSSEIGEGCALAHYKIFQILPKCTPNIFQIYFLQISLRHLKCIWMYRMFFSNRRGMRISPLQYNKYFKYYSNISPMYVRNTQISLPHLKCTPYLWQIGEGCASAHYKPSLYIYIYTNFSIYIYF